MRSSSSGVCFSWGASCLPRDSNRTLRVRHASEAGAASLFVTHFVWHGLSELRYDHKFCTLHTRRLGSSVPAMLAVNACAGRAWTFLVLLECPAGPRVRGPRHAGPHRPGSAGNRPALAPHYQHPGSGEDGDGTPDVDSYSCTRRGLLGRRWGCRVCGDWRVQPRVVRSSSACSMIKGTAAARCRLQNVSGRKMTEKGKKVIVLCSAPETTKGGLQRF